MRRKSSAAVDQVDPRDLIARITAEHDSPSSERTAYAGSAGSSGRHRTDGAARLTVPVQSTGAHRRPDDRPADPADLAVLADLPWQEARGDDLNDDRHEDRSVVEIDREVPHRRWTARRLAPLGVGVAAVLAGTLIFTLLQPGTQDPDLSAALTTDSSRRAVSDSTLATSAAAGDSGSRTLADVTQGANNQIGAALAEQAAQQRRDAQRAAAAASAPSSGGGGGGGLLGGVAQVAGDGVQAALKLGWGALAGGDEFLGNSLGANWSAYDGPGHDGKGRRTPDAVSVANGILTIRGDSEGNTGGISWGDSRKYGKWEVRARYPKGDKQYHPVLLLWPTAENWPSGGEVDFAETNSAADDTSFFLHYGSSNSQKTAKQNLDLTQWHNYGVEWTPQGITGYIDGVKWFSSTDPDTLPPGPMHPTIQLDYFPDGGSPQPSEMQVAWLRQYR